MTNNKELQCILDQINEKQKVKVDTFLKKIKSEEGLKIIFLGEGLMIINE